MPLAYIRVCWRNACLHIHPVGYHPTAPPAATLYRIPRNHGRLSTRMSTGLSRLRDIGAARLVPIVSGLSTGAFCVA